MTPHEMLNNELNKLRHCYPLPGSYVDFCYGWHSDNIVWVRIFNRCWLAEWFSFKIETEDDISEFRKKMAEALRRANRDE